MSMEIDDVAPLPLQQQAGGPQIQAATILCCNCGAPINGTTAAGALCEDCVRLSVDASQGVQRDALIHICKDCERWLQPPAQWISAAPESRELLAICLKRLRGLQKVRVIDAGFVWTEPHSRRLKVKITMQQDYHSGTVMQQTIEVEYVVRTHQCPDCAKSYTHNTWRASVQVRQKVPHKRTFLHLEQIILKNNAHKDTINIKEAPNGLDFFFAQKNEAERMVTFLASVIPARVKRSQELVSLDVHTATRSYKLTYSIELIPICRDDLVILPIKMARSLGNISPLVLCHRVGNSLSLLDPTTLQISDLSGPVYWRTPFNALSDIRELVEFVVLDIEPIGQINGPLSLADATIARASDLGSNDQVYFVKTHLGSILHAGDSVMGYHLSRSNYNHPQLEALENSTYSSTIPDVVLVKKSYPGRRKNRTRNWKLKRMPREEEGGIKETKRKARVNGPSIEDDFETFLRDVEEDPELRGTLDIYKEKKAAKAKKVHMDVDQDTTMGEGEGEEEEEEEEEGEDDGIPKINVDELLEDFEDLGIEDEQSHA